MDVMTIGHSNHSIDTFIGMLKANAVTMLVDVRSSPRSRYCPQFNRAAFEASIRAAGITYFYRGDKLGGFATPGPEMAAALRSFLEWRDANPDQRPALMCAEKNPYDCHRFVWLANWIIRSSDMTVINIMPGDMNWIASLDNLPTLEAAEASALIPLFWRVTGVRVGFATKELAEGYCKEIGHGATTYRVRTRPTPLQLAS